MKTRYLILILLCLLCVLLLTSCKAPTISFKPLEDVFDGMMNGLSNFGDGIAHMFDNFTKGLPGPK